MITRGTTIVFAAMLALATACGGTAGEEAAPTPASEATTDQRTATESTDASEDGMPAASSPEEGSDTEVIEWEDARVFIEHNGEDGDFGFHAEFGGEPWSSATILDPDGDLIFTASAAGLLGEHGVSGVFFESAEFPPDELTREAFLDRFPEGEYGFTGETLEGESLVGSSTFTHLVPDPPVIASPERDSVVVADEVVVSWEPVATPDGVEIEVYILQLFPVDPPEGHDPIALNIDYTFEVPAQITQIRLLPELFEPGESYEFELMAVDAAGNQAFALGAFTIAA